MLHWYVGTLHGSTFFTIFSQIADTNQNLVRVMASSEVARCMLAEFGWAQCNSWSSRILGLATRLGNGGCISPRFIASLSSSSSVCSRSWYDVLSVPLKTLLTRLEDEKWESSSSRVVSCYLLLTFMVSWSILAFSGASVSRSGFIISSNTSCCHAGRRPISTRELKAKTECRACGRKGHRAHEDDSEK